MQVERLKWTLHYAYDHVAHDLQHHIKSYIGISARINVVEVGGIERSAG